MHDVDISLAHPCEIDRWMALVDRVKAAFPGLETPEALAEHRRTVLGFMERSAALCAGFDGKIVGALLFSRENSMLCFLAVDPGFRRQKIAEKLVRHMFTLLDSDRAVTVITYREGVPEGCAARAFYRHLCFAEGKLTEEFGSPVQEFVLTRPRVDAG